jgi:hypothetical protein
VAAHLGNHFALQALFQKNRISSPIAAGAVASTVPVDGAT